jgi:hypothetical protein
MRVHALVGLALLMTGCHGKKECRELVLDGTTPLFSDRICPHPKARIEMVKDNLVCRCPETSPSSFSNPNPIPSSGE